MELDLQDVKAAADLAKPFIEPLIKAFITPKAEALKKWLKKNNLNDQVVDNHFESIFDEYLVRTYQRFSNLNILVFPNQQINIKSIYQPLSIRSTKDHRSHKVITFDPDIIRPYQKILISDTAGMGKSTLSKWIGLSLIEQGISLPVLIELKKIKETNSLIDELYNQLNPISPNIDRDLILKFLELGEFTIILDGFDEIEYDQRTAVILNLKDFISKTQKNWFIMTSRPDSSLSSFGDFQMFHIEPLKIRESFELIKKYDGLNKNKISKQLITDIQDKSPQVQEFLINPFLVSLLYKTYTYNKDIPTKKSTFYDEVFGALYKHHDLSKDGFKRNKKSGLDIQDFRVVLRQLAFDTAKVVKVEYSEQDLVKYLHDAKGKCAGLEFKEQKFIEDIESNVPLFVREGSNLKWAHKSLQDFFAAEYINYSTEKEEIITLIYNSKKDNYLNILDFIYELEYKLFRKVIIKDIINRYILYCDNSYIELDSIPVKLKRQRQSLTFGVSYGLYCTKKMDEEFQTITNLFPTEFSLGTRSITRHHAKTRYFYILFGSSYDTEIINLLRRQNEPIFSKQVLKNIRPDQLSEFIPENVPIICDDVRGNFVNDKTYFQKVNELLSSQRYTRNQSKELSFLDYEKCKRFLVKIDREEQIDNNDNPLAGI